MKIGNAPLPITDRIGRQKELSNREGKAVGPDGETAQPGSSERLERSRTAERIAEGGVASAEEAMRLAGATRDLIAENNREAANLHGNVDPKRLLDLLV